VKKRNRHWLRWALWVPVLLILVLNITFTVANGNAQAPTDPEGPGQLDLFIAVGVITTLVSGALIASRRPENPIGWILYGMGLWMAFGGFGQAYAVHALIAAPGSLPFGEVMAWVDSSSSGPAFLGLWVFVFLLFPNGRLLSARWRIVLWLGIVALAGLALAAFQPGPLNDFGTINNPFGIQSLAAVLDTVVTLSFWLCISALAASVVSLVLRFRRAHGDERQQLKWFASAALFMALIFMTAPIIWFTPALANTLLWPILFVLAELPLPIAIVIAILRYHLYDIDFLIRRTLTYSIVTALLLMVYFASVILLQQAVATVTGSQQNELVTVLSTLAIAALFVPLRNRIQNAIDRRFNRQRYDAQKVLNQFATTVRDETDLEKLTGSLIDVVNETMQPRSVSLWLKPAADRRPLTEDTTSG